MQSVVRRFIEEALVRGVPLLPLVKAVRERFGRTKRQAHGDVRGVLEGWREENDVIRQRREQTLIDLAIGCDRRESEIRQAFDDDDPHRAFKAEQDRCKLLGLYHADRRHVPHTTLAESRELRAEIKTRWEQMSPEERDRIDPADRQVIEPPPPRRVTEARQTRIERLRAWRVAGIRGDQLAALAKAELLLSPRQLQADLRLVDEQLRIDGFNLQQGTHYLQLLPLAVRRRDRLTSMAAQRGDAKLAAAIEIDRCKLLGLYARQRPKPHEDDLTGVRAAA